ncbi:Histone-lysine N-methyltransferase ATXR6 [Platanthera zijinensis]|uniref:Histone-lysine N-methyltransferase ATXR6 n=1 Tax=Platanthera zijinensis TaxID=2320716 RepID=A0AAP0C4T1_9ASPA
MNVDDDNAGLSSSIGHSSFIPLKVLSKEDMETLSLCKGMMERRECQPLVVVFDPRKGYVFFVLFSVSDWLAL